MGKPSIFSKDYERKMKRRRITIILSIIVIVILFLGAWFMGKGKSFISSKKDNALDNKKVNNDKQTNKNVNTNTSTNNNEAKVSKEEKKPEGYEVKLSNGQNIKIIYEEENKDKKFKYIYPLDSKVKYDISPSNKKAVIYDDKAQKIICVDINGKVSDVTNLTYTSTDGSVVINHDEFIKSRPDYVWCNMPKFIDENNIAYISQLPWLNKTAKYVWIFNIPNNTHINTQNIYGEEITIDKLNEKGLKILVDGKTLFLNANGGVTE
ncbi:hypothetical protein [Clostridium lundense]|uniref:hypothetical protein n=1 Tax=Clostridium lundense TaxID=319475 RepID=UPI0004843F9C|nr:hypothetical protein [Clostridium lundense]